LHRQSERDQRSLIFCYSTIESAFAHRTKKSEGRGHTSAATSFVRRLRNFADSMTSMAHDLHMTTGADHPLRTPGSSWLTSADFVCVSRRTNPTGMKTPRPDQMSLLFNQAGLRRNRCSQRVRYSVTDGWIGLDQVCKQGSRPCLNQNFAETAVNSYI
jgi:hypothetical protein